MSFNTARRTAAVLLSVAAATAITACGSSSGSSDAGSNAASTGNAVVTQAKTAIAKHTDIAQFTPPGPPLKADKLKGKKVLVVAHDLVADELVSIAKGIQQAAGVAGLDVRVFNGNATVSMWQQGIAQGISQHVDAIMLDGIPTSEVHSSIEAADRAHIPVIAVEDSKPSNGAGQGAGSGVFGNVEPPDYLFGQLIAATAIARSNGHVQAGILTFNNPIAVAAVDGMKAELSKCAGCKIVTTKDYEPNVWSSQITSGVESLIRSEPDMNFILSAADTMGIFATAGVRQAVAANKVKVLGVDGSGSATLNLVKQGNIMVADPGSSPTWLGWAGVDQSMRAILGMKPAKPLVPYRYLGTEQLASADPSNLGTVYGTNYVAGYKKLWGLDG